MYFVIQDGTIEPAQEQEWLKSQSSISVFSTKEWEEQVEFRNDYHLNQPFEQIHFCKIEIHADYLFGTVRLPGHNKAGYIYGFAFYILPGCIAFIDDTSLVTSGIAKLSDTKKRREYSLEKFLYDLLISFVENDLRELDRLEHSLTILEEQILAGHFDKFNQSMIAIKKEVSRRYRFYSQLADLGEDLSENEIDFFGRDEIATFRLFSERVSRLQSEAQVLREYAMQVQDIYQSEISIRQNEVMKVLTLVTTIFLPLTLLVGWYGMNFVSMPEITWKYGYLFVAILAVCIIAFCIWIFKHKKLM